MKMNKLLRFIFVLFIIYLLYLLARSISNPTFFNSSKENYRNMLKSNTHPWSPDLIRRFQEYQTTTFDNSYQFDMDQLQKQASPEEAEYLMKHDKWPWSPDTQHYYLNAINHSTLLQILPKEALEDVQQIYNEAAMRQLLAWNDKEGEFLLSGVKLMDNQRLENERPENNFARALETDMSIRCDGSKGMVWSRNNKKIENADLPDIIPGFQFGEKGVCNPCGPLKDVPDYSCPFTLNIDGNASVSPIWQDYFVIADHN